MFITYKSIFQIEHKKNRLFFYALFFFVPQVFSAVQDNQKLQYQQLLVHQAIQTQLDQKKYWHLLLHYNTNVFNQIESEQDATFFFNAIDGKSNPQSELVETIKSFFLPSDYLSKITKVHPQCQFKARYEWLKRQLKFDPLLLKEQNCPFFKKWIHVLAPKSATLVFPAGSIKYPSAMFGHTLLRLNRDKKKSPTLLNYSVNYAAHIDLKDTNPLKYAFNGIFGFYDGIFSVLPYYIKVNEYIDIDSREVWEYNLKLTEEELYLMALHIWELHFAKFDYYFFKENCSYHLLSLIELANPKYDLRSAYNLYTLPSDTIKQLQKYNLIAESQLRNSTINKLKTKLDLLSPKGYQFIEKNIDHPQFENMDEWKNLTTHDQARIYEIKYEQFLVQADASFDQEARKVLIKRAKLAYISPKIPTIKYVADPLKGHDGQRLQLSIGHDLIHNQFIDYEYRLIYHSLDDLNDGFEPYAAIEFFKLNFRKYEKQSLVLENFTILSLKSYKPRAFYYNFLSWSLETAIKRKNTFCFRCHYFYLNGSVGKTFSFFNTNFSLMLHTDYQYLHHPKHVHNLLTGLRFVLYKGIDTKWKFLIENDILKSIHSKEYKNYLNATLAYGYQTNQSMRFGYYNNNNHTSYDLSWRFYY